MGGAAYFLIGRARLLDGAERQPTDLLRPRPFDRAAAAEQADAESQPGVAGPPRQAAAPRVEHVTRAAHDESST